MKSLFKTFLISACTFLGLMSCTEKSTSGIALDKTSLTLEIGKTETITVFSEPDRAMIMDAQWSSSAPEIATVDNGTVTAVSAGKATITATHSKGTATCEVTIDKPFAVAITLNHDKISLKKGGSTDLIAVILPPGAEIELKWESLDEKIATVDQNGKVTAVAIGTTSVKVSSGELSDECVVEVRPDYGIGDYYYSDGTISSTYNNAKTPIGVIFWVGDPTAQDKTLKADHPECTHGLAVSIDQDYTHVEWQTNYAKYRNTPGAWLEKNKPGFMPVSVNIPQKQHLENISGYNNTKALEAFNAASENSEWPIDVITRLQAYRNANPTPKGTSNWYVPSVKELVLLIGGEYEGLVLDVKDHNKNKETINNKLQLLPKSDPIGKINWKEDYWVYDFWASADINNEMAYYINTHNGKIFIGYKDQPKEYEGMHLIRPVFAF